MLRSEEQRTLYFDDNDIRAKTFASILRRIVTDALTQARPVEETRHHLGRKWPYDSLV